MDFRYSASQSPAKTYGEVTPYLFISGYLAAADASFIQQKGITRIVKMFEDDLSYPGGYHRHPGVKYAVFPALDAPNYDIRNDAAQALAFIEEGVNAGERVLVHCHAGISRSATIILLYLMVHRDLPLSQALVCLQNARNIVSPNLGFMCYLYETDNILQTNRRTKLQDNP